MDREEFHNRIRTQQFTEDVISYGEWMHGCNAKKYYEVGDRLVKKGLSYEDALEILEACFYAASDEYGE